MEPFGIGLACLQVAGRIRSRANSTQCDRIVQLYVCAIAVVFVVELALPQSVGRIEAFRTNGTVAHSQSNWHAVRRKVWFVYYRSKGIDETKRFPSIFRCSRRSGLPHSVGRIKAFPSNCPPSIGRWNRSCSYEWLCSRVACRIEGFSSNWYLEKRRRVLWCDISNAVKTEGFESDSTAWKEGTLPACVCDYLARSPGLCLQEVVVSFDPTWNRTDVF
jgi:hypothetical protein